MKGDVIMSHASQPRKMLELRIQQAEGLPSGSGRAVVHISAGCLSDDRSPAAQPTLEVLASTGEAAIAGGCCMFCSWGTLMLQPGATSLSLQVWTLRETGASLTATQG